MRCNSKKISLEPLIGRYVTLQKLNENDPNGHFINWREVTVDSVPANLAEEETIRIAVDSSFDLDKPASQCGPARPWAYKGGNKCCKKAFVTSQHSLINFDSQDCGQGLNTENSNCGNKPCYNNDYQRLV